MISIFICLRNIFLTSPRQAISLLKFHSGFPQKKKKKQNPPKIPNNNKTPEKNQKKLLFFFFILNDLQNSIWNSVVLWKPWNSSFHSFAIHSKSLSSKRIITTGFITFMSWEEWLWRSLMLWKFLHAIYWVFIIDKIKFLCHDYDLLKNHHKCRISSTQIL